LVENDLQGFLEELQPVSVYAALRPRGVPLNFGGAHAIIIPRRNTTRSALNDVSGAWVGEGGVIPVKQIALASQTLYRYKAAVISTFTQEVLEQSTPSIEGIVRQAILDDTAIALDGALLGNSAVVAGVRPAGLMLGVTPTGSSGNTAENIITDLKVLFKAMVDARAQRPVLIMNPNRLLGLSTVTTAAGGFMFRDELAGATPTLLGVPVITSLNVTDTVVMIMDAASFASANDTPDFNISDQAALTMANADGTAPTQANASGGTTIGTAEQVIPGGGIDIGQAANTPNAGYTSLSLYQTYSTALRMILPTSWGLIRPNVVASLSGVNW
jgi:HK97 family phage major capsid protein